MPTQPVALTILQFAELYQLNPRTIATNVTRAPHLLPPITRLGRNVRFLRKDIEDWLKCNKL